MGKIDAWIPKIPRLKNAKVSRFSYRDAAYTNDNIEGVENYDYSRDMNVPSLTKTDTEPSVLDSGARAQFSSLTKNALNHFFGRVSYNLNKVIDFLSDFLDDFITLQAATTELREDHDALQADTTELREDHDALQETTTNLSDSFIGMIAAFSATSDFSGWLFCDGRAVSRTQYAKLFARIGTVWGIGDGVTTFRIPDLREVTLVGAGDSPRTMTDPDVFTVAQFKDATFKSHTHGYRRPEALSIQYSIGATTVSSTSASIIDTQSTGSTVTRANSMGVGYFIRSL